MAGHVGDCWPTAQQTHQIGYDKRAFNYLHSNKVCFASAGVAMMSNRRSKMIQSLIAVLERFIWATENEPQQAQPIHNLPKLSPPFWPFQFFFFASDFSWPNQFDALRSAAPALRIQFERWNNAFLSTGIDRFRLRSHQKQNTCRPVRLLSLLFFFFVSVTITISDNLFTQYFKQEDDEHYRFLLLTINVHATTRTRHKHFTFTRSFVSHRHIGCSEQRWEKICTK